MLNNPQIIGGVFDGPTINGATINGGVSNQQQIIGAQVDCTTQGCTQPGGICNASLATTAFVCTAINDALSGSNPLFCTAVSDCLIADPGGLCTAIANCIATTPGIINANGAFGVNARATTALYGVARYATLAEFENANCLLAIDPCTLAAFWNAPNLASAMWTAFSNAVGTALSLSPAVCAAVFACGAAPIASPAFTGIPTAPTAAPGTSTTQIATTAFVQAAVTAAVTCVGLVPSWTAAGGNPGAGVRFLADDCQRYTSAQIVAAGGGGGGGGGAVIARGRFKFDASGVPFTSSPSPIGFFNGCSVLFNTPFNGAVTITLNAAASNAFYSVLTNEFAVSGAPTTTSFVIGPAPGAILNLSSFEVDFAVIDG